MQTKAFPCCPVCKAALTQNGGALQCENRHSFDLSREGYANLLTAQHKSGALIGDNRAMANARRQFLERGFFSPLRDAVADFVSRSAPQTVLDICCGEGYYAEAAAAAAPCRLFGFDLSKEMVRLAAKRKIPNAFFFVANLAAIPLPDESVDAALHLFAPFNAASFSRVLRPGGLLLSVIPGKEHLFALKQAVYEKPYFNDEKKPDSGDLILLDETHVKSKILLQSPDEIRALFSMTPYAYRTSPQDSEKLLALQTLETELDFLLLTYQKHL